MLKPLRKLKDECIHYKTVGTAKIPYPRFFTPWTVEGLRLIFTNMVDRCYNTECQDYKFYGARGIKVCDEWLNAPWEFEKWALSHGYKKGLTIDRINGNGNYEPINCQWVSRSYNCRFTGRSKPITAKVTLTTVQWSKLLDEKDNFIAEMRKKYGLKYTTEYIEEHLLNKKVLIKRQNTIKEQVQQQLLQEELERQTGNKPE